MKHISQTQPQQAFENFRKGLLQIRAKMASQEWNEQWQNTVLEALIGAAQKDIA